MANNFRVKDLYAESIKVNSRPTVNGTGVALSGDNAATVTNGVYLTGNQTISGNKTFLNNVIVSGTNNSFGSFATSNTFGDSAQSYNDFGYEAVNNNFGTRTVNTNTFGTDSSFNYIGYNSLYNFFGNSQGNGFEDSRQTNNEFGCMPRPHDGSNVYNIFGFNADYNYFGQYSNDNRYYSGFAYGQFTFDTIPKVGNAQMVLTTGNQTISGIKTFATGVSISGDLTVDTNTLYVDSINNEVGIGTVSPTEKLEVIGSISANPTSDTYTLQNKNASALQSAFERVRGWLVWSYNSFIGRLKTADISAAREWLLPNSSGTIPITTLTTGSVSAEETFRTALYREMMWMGFQARRLFGAGPTSTYGTSTPVSAGTNFVSAGLGNVTVGSKSVSTWETGMSQQPGAGAFWKIPTSFSVSGGFYTLAGWSSSTTSNITIGSNTFLLDGGANGSNNAFLVGHRIWNSNFPDGTRITTVVGQTITVDKNATGNGGASNPIVSAYDAVNRIVLGTRNDATVFGNGCALSVATTNHMLTVGGYVSGATQITVSAPITYTASGTSGNTFITATTTPSLVVTGMIVSGNGIPANTIVASVAGTQINLNRALTGNVTSIAVGFAPTMIAASTTAMGPAVYIASGTSGTNFITLTTTPIGFANGYIVSGAGITGGTTITSIAGNQVNLSTTLAGDVTSIGVTFMQSSAVLPYAYAYGIPDNTKISSITSSTTSSNIVVNLDTAVTGDTRYNTGLVGQVGTPLVYAPASTSIGSGSANNIFIEILPNRSTGKTEIRIGYQRAGRMFYSPTAQFYEGEIPSVNFTLYYQFIIDYSSTTNELRLWANRNTTSGTSVPARPLQSNVLITLATPSDLVQQLTSVYWGIQSCDDGVKPPFFTSTNSMTWRDAMYFPFTTAA
jgi:hypothetical protein